MEKMRCFIAVELPLEAKSALDCLQTELKRGQQSFVKWVRADNIHITLKFLGSTPVEAIKDIVQSLTKVANSSEPFHLELGGLGCFPNWNRPQVIWVGLGGEVERLANLQKEVDLAMHTLGFAQESRAFVPHLTLARIKGGSQEDIKFFGERVSATEFAKGVPIDVDELSLMESKLTPSGPLYNQLALAQLG